MNSASTMAKMNSISADDWRRLSTRKPHTSTQTETATATSSPKAKPASAGHCQRIIAAYMA